jgi:uncharacterized protein (TIGR02246 family)
MSGDDERQIEQLLGELTDAWNRGDANAYGARYLADATFTNANGSFYLGRDEFDRRHEEIFRGVLRGTTLAMTINKLRFVRPDVAIVDVGTGISGSPLRPQGVEVEPDGLLRSCLLMVLLKQDGGWWIAAYHNVWRGALANRAAMAVAYPDCAIAIFGFCAPHA